MPYSVLGSIQMDGNGNFTMTTYTANGTGSAAQAQTATGTYSVNPDCTLNLSFSSNGSNGGATGAFVPPSVFAGVLTNTGTNVQTATAGQTAGLITVQPSSGQTLTGLVIAQ